LIAALFARGAGASFQKNPAKPGTGGFALASAISDSQSVSITLAIKKMLSLAYV
jgi:hypothetical protein